MHPTDKRVVVHSEEEMRQLGASLKLARGDTVLLFGELGAGKTTLVRGYLESLGHKGPVRSPTFNLLQVFDTAPPVLHADLYRVESTQGLGIEDYLDSHVCFIEWAERAQGLIDIQEAWTVRIGFVEGGRIVRIDEPLYRSSGSSPRP